MEKQGALVLMVFVFMVALPMGHCDTEGAKEVYEWFSKLPYAKEKVTKFHFFNHETYNGTDVLTAVKTSQANGSNQSPYLFGTVYIMDDVLREGIELTSKEVGRAQGLYTFSGVNEMDLLMAFSWVFTTGKYNGSSLTVVGRSLTTRQRELPIIGGSGVFRLARGVASAELRDINIFGKAVVEYNVVVIHY